MFKRIKDKYIQLGLTRYYRIERYLREIESEFKLPSKDDKMIVEEIRELINERIKILKKITWTTFIFYLGIYISFISLVFGDFFIIGEIAQITNLIVGFFGTTLFLVGIFILNRIAELYYQDLQLLTSHIISIYNSRGKIISDDGIPLNKSTYGVFLKFFKTKK